MAIILFASSALLSCATSPPPNPHLQGASSASELDSENYREPLSFDEIDYPRIQAALVLATNEARTAHGRAPVKYHPVLEEAAHVYAMKMAEEAFLSHEDPHDESMRTPKQRIAALGAENPLPAENIATHFGLQLKSGEPYYVLGEDAGVSRQPGGPPIAPHTYASFARAVVRQWLDSPGHRRNLLSSDALQLGVGAAHFEQGGVPAFILVQKFQLYEPLVVD